MTAARNRLGLMCVRDRLNDLLASVTFFVTRALPLGLRAVLIFSLARSSDPIIFSKVASSFAVVETLRFVFDWGQDTLSIKLFSRSGMLWVRAIRPCLTIKALTWLGGAGINFALIYFFFLSNNTSVAAAIAVLGVCPLFWNVPINVMQSRGLLKKNNGKLWMLGAALFAVAVWVAQGVDLSSVLYYYLGIEYTGLGALALIAWLSKPVPPSQWPAVRRSRTKQLKIYIRRGSAVVLGQIAALCYGKFDIILVVNFSAPSTIAQYLFAQRILDLAGFLSGGASSVMYSTMARLTKDDRSRWVALSRRWAIVFLSIAGLTGFAFWVGIPIIVDRFFEGMRGANEFILLFGFVAIFSVANQYSSGLLNSMGRFWVIARLNIFNLCFLLSAGSIAYKAFGAPGLITAVAVVYAVSAVIQLYLLRKSIENSRL